MMTVVTRVIWRAALEHKSFLRRSATTSGPPKENRRKWNRCAPGAARMHHSSIPNAKVPSSPLAGPGAGGLRPIHVAGSSDLNGEKQGRRAKSAATIKLYRRACRTPACLGVSASARWSPRTCQGCRSRRHFTSASVGRYTNRKEKHTVETLAATPKHRQEFYQCVLFVHRPRTLKASKPPWVTTW